MPYQKSSTCPHSSLRVERRRLSDGSEASPFYIYPDENEVLRSEPIQFTGEVCQDIVWQGLDADGHYAAQLADVRFVMTAQDPNLGHLSIVHDATRPGGFGRLRSLERGKEFPVLHTTRVHVTAVSSAMPGVVLQNHGLPLKFVAQPSMDWPPKEVIYTLMFKIKFEVRLHPGQILVTATAGSVVVGGF